MNMSSPESNGTSLPDIPDETSRGSSVSSGFQREYEEILKFAIVTPKFEIASNVYEQETRNPPQQARLPVANSRPIFGMEGMNLSTIEERLSSESTITDTDEEKVAPISSKDKPPTSLLQANQSLTSQQKMSRFTRLSTPETTHSTRNVANSSDGVRALERIVSNDVNSKRQNTVAFSSPLSETSSSSAVTSPASISVDDLDNPIDQDMIKMEGLMDEWCLELKRNVLGEFSASKLKLIEKLKQKIYVQKQRHAGELNGLQNEMEGLKELLHTFEKSVHQKDIVITNLTDAVQKQKEKCEKLKILLTWKLKHNDEKREEFAGKLARKHYERSLASKTWAGWRSIVESRWKQRVERACQARSQEVCIKLTEDYEERLQGLQKSLESARAEVARMHSERDQYEETMKKAFMRGVCALNMEAMHMFKDGDDENCDPRTSEPAPQKLEAQPTGRPMQQVQQKQAISHNRTDPTAQLQSNSRKSAMSNAKIPAERKVHVKAIGKGDFPGKRPQHGNSSVQPNMVTSVFVERHQEDQRQHPSVKGPSGPKDQQSKSQTSRGPYAASGVSQRTNRLQTVKVVE